MLNQKRRTSQNGLSNVEMIPVLLVFALLFNFTIGAFGIIHSGILQSIASRNYAFETFRNRSNLNRLRDVGSNQDITYNRVGFRFHGKSAEDRKGDTWIAATRALRFTDQGLKDSAAQAKQDHSQVDKILDPGKASDVYTGEDAGISRVWLKITYGICLTADCAPVGGRP